MILAGPARTHTMFRRPLKGQLLTGDPVLLCDRADWAAGSTRRHYPGRDVMGDHTARSDDGAFPDGDVAADHRVSL